jgi:hypothetical protein
VNGLHLAPVTATVWLVERATGNTSGDTDGVTDGDADPAPYSGRRRYAAAVLTIDGVRISVRGLEAIDTTPVVDIKPVLGPVSER